MNKTKCITLLLLSLLTLSVSSCDLAIDSTAANSMSAILAVIGEYSLAVISIVLVFVLHLTRSFSVSLILLSVLGIANVVALPISPFIVLAFGFLLLFSFVIPIKAYKPKVIIDKNVKKVLEKDTVENKHQRKGFVIEIGVGILLLCIEYYFFAK